MVAIDPQSEDLENAVSGNPYFIINLVMNIEKRAGNR